MQPHQQRVVEEKQELDSKIEKLMAFFDTEIFNGLDIDERLRLKKQGEYMRGYSEILGLRIANF